MLVLLQLLWRVCLRACMCVCVHVCESSTSISVCTHLTQHHIYRFTTHCPLTSLELAVDTSETQIYTFTSSVEITCMLQFSNRNLYPSPNGSHMIIQLIIISDLMHRKGLKLQLYNITGQWNRYISKRSLSLLIYIYINLKPYSAHLAVSSLYRGRGGEGFGWLVLL